MDASHPGSERADLKILFGEDWKRLWQERAEKKGRPSKRKSMEPELQFSLDESFQESPFISKKSRMTPSHTSSPTPSVRSSPEMPPPSTPYYSPSPVYACTALLSHASSNHSLHRHPLRESLHHQDLLHLQNLLLQRAPLGSYLANCVL